MNKISVLGCGWLGLPLAEKLLSLKYQVSGSTTRSERLKTLEKAGITHHLICLKEREVVFEPEENFSNFFKTDVLVFNIPPKAAFQDHFSQVKFLFSLLSPDAWPKKMIFVSSTSVYRNGVDQIRLCDENTLPEPDQAGGKVLLRVEQWLKKQMQGNLTVLRMGGLIGQGRHPSVFLSRKYKSVQQKTEGEIKKRLLQPTNFLHHSDAVSIIVDVIKNQWWGETFNAVCSKHPLRLQFIKGKTDAQGKEFNQGDWGIPPKILEGVAGKKVVNDKLKEKGYRFLVDDPLLWSKNQAL